MISKFIDAYNKFNLDSMLDLLHPEIKFRNISNGEINAETAGKQEFETFAGESIKLFREREQKIVSYSEENDAVNVEIQYNGVLAIDLSDKLKAGDSINLRGKSEYTFKDGLIYSIIDES